MHQQLRWLLAVEAFKKRRRLRFLRHSEYLSVAHELGYRSRGKGVDMEALKLRLRRACRHHSGRQIKADIRAALAWMEVTMKCVQCHKYIRDRDDAAAR